MTTPPTTPPAIPFAKRLSPVYCQPIVAAWLKARPGQCFSALTIATATGFQRGTVLLALRELRRTKTVKSVGYCSRYTRWQISRCHARIPVAESREID